MSSSTVLGQHLHVQVPTVRTSLQANRNGVTSSARSARVAARAHRQQLLSRDGENAADTTSDTTQRRRGSGLGDLLGPIGLTLGGHSRSVRAAQTPYFSRRTPCVCTEQLLFTMREHVADGICREQSACRSGCPELGVDCRDSLSSPPFPHLPSICACQRGSSLVGSRGIHSVASGTSGYAANAGCGARQRGGWQRSC